MVKDKITALASRYAQACENYRRALHKLWNLDVMDTWWIPSTDVGGMLSVNGILFLDMAELRLIVDHEVSRKDCEKWWEYNTEISNYGRKQPQINAYHWFVLGCRSDHLGGAE